MFTSMEQKTLRQLLSTHLEWLRVKHYSPDTLRTREEHLRSFLQWTDARGLIYGHQINHAMLERYQRHLFYSRKKNGEPLSAVHQCNRLICIKVWFRWMVREKYCPFNPASELELPKVEKHLPKTILSEKEVETVLSLPDIKTGQGLRDRAILEMFYSTGMRRSELVKLQLHDIDWDRGVVFIRLGKGKKDRFVPIGDRALQWLEKYQYDSRPDYVVGSSGQTLFLNYLGEGISPKGLSAIVRKYITKAKLGKSGSCHVFRHTFATHLLENGADLRHIQAMLGHSDINTTTIYTQVSMKELKRVHGQRHPAAEINRQRLSDVVSDET